MLDKSVKEGFSIGDEGILCVINHDGGVIFEAKVFLNLLDDDVESKIIDVVGSLLPPANGGVEDQANISSEGGIILLPE